MAIKSYVPPKLKMIDHRNPEGGYYTANCDICGTEYYPKRSNSKYCSGKCAVVSHRVANAANTVVKKYESKPKKEKTSGEVVKSLNNVVWWFDQRGMAVRGLQTKLKGLAIGDMTAWNGIDIVRETMSKYRVG